MNKKIFVVFAVSAILIGISSCSSDSDDAVYYQEREYPYKWFAQRYGLSDDVIGDLLFTGEAYDENIAVYTAVNNNNLAVFICDTVSNSLIFSDLNTLVLAAKEFSFPYGEKAVLSPQRIFLGGFANTNTIAAFPLTIYYGDGSITSTYSACQIYHCFYKEGKLSITEQSCKSINPYSSAVERVVKWFDDSIMFFNSSLGEVTYYDKYGLLICKTIYPHFKENDINYNLFNTDILQPISFSEAVGVNFIHDKENRYISIFSVDVLGNKLLWHKQIYSIGDYDFKVDDRVKFSNTSFQNNIISFDVYIVSYDGSVRNFKVKVSENGEIISYN